jgi:hypothetical protein
MGWSDKCFLDGWRGVDEWRLKAEGSEVVGVSTAVDLRRGATRRHVPFARRGTGAERCEGRCLASV